MRTGDTTVRLLAGRRAMPVAVARGARARLLACDLLRPKPPFTYFPSPPPKPLPCSPTSSESLTTPNGHGKLSPCYVPCFSSVLFRNKSASAEIEGSAKRQGLGCVNSLPGSAWLQLSKQPRLLNILKVIIGALLFWQRRLVRNICPMQKGGPPSSVLWPLCHAKIFRRVKHLWPLYFNQFCWSDNSI